MAQSSSEPTPRSSYRTQVHRRHDNRVAQAVPSDRERALAERTPEPRLRIAMLAPPWIPVPPPGYGGIEFVVALLCDALVEHGHDVDLFCAPGSSSRANVRPVLDSAHPNSIERALIESDHVSRVFEIVEDEARAGRPYDVIHDNDGYTALTIAHYAAAPLVHTVHGPFDRDTTPYYDHHGHKGTIVCISEAQASMAPPGATADAVVHNPIDVDAWPVGEHKQDYLLWVGRFVPEKGPQRAIRVARQAGRPLVLAGVVQPGHERFFATDIQPHIDGEMIRYVGEIGGARKQQAFAEAFAFLMPIRWPEPFGMVMVEALAAGTPVLAFRQGAAPEIVEHGRNGFLVEDEDQMAAVVDAAGELDPWECRRSAERFAPDHVALGYEAAYRKAMSSRASEAQRFARAAGAPAS